MKNNNKRVAIAIQEEKLYFSSHPVYSLMPPGMLGIESLIQKLTDLMYKHIR